MMQRYPFRHFTLDTLVASTYHAFPPTKLIDIHWFCLSCRPDCICIFVNERIEIDICIGIGVGGWIR